LQAPIASVGSWSTLPITITWRIGPMRLPQPKHFSMHLHVRWLMAQPKCHGARPSMVLPRRRSMFRATSTLRTP
jgi:hypothetical protein